MPTYEDNIGYLFNQHLNIEVLMLATDDGDMLLNLRARPWKNSAYDGYMLLAAGFTFEDALMELAEAHRAGYWLPLDWKRRERNTHASEVPKSQPFTDQAIGASEKPQEPTFIHHPYTRS